MNLKRQIIKINKNRNYEDDNVGVKDTRLMNIIRI